MMKNRLSVWIGCASVVFFSIILNPRWKLSWVVNPTVIGIVSLIGLLLAIRELRHRSKRWYLGIPQAIVLIIVCSIGPIGFIVTRRVQAMEFLSISLYLLSFGSACFFLSFPDTMKKITLPCALIAGLISLFALFGLNSSIGGILHPLQTSWNVVGLFEGLYMLFLMPVIGLCYLFIAYRVRE